MGTVEVAFAAVVSLLAAVCVILALVTAITWLWLALRRIVAGNRPASIEQEYRDLQARAETRR